VAEKALPRGNFVFELSQILQPTNPPPKKKFDVICEGPQKCPVLKLWKMNCVFLNMYEKIS